MIAARGWVVFCLGCAFSIAFAAAEPELGGAAPAAALSPSVVAPDDEDRLMGLIAAREDSVKPTCVPLELWCRMRTGFELQDLDDPEIERQLRRMLRSPRALERRLAQGGRYLPDILAAVEDAGVPSELALLPLVESGFDPQATSPAQAAGLWQFIPATGRRFGLTQNWLMDERRTIPQATRSALTYLKQLHDEFGDWLLALAAYNWGEGNLRRAIARTNARPATFLDLRLPLETRAYVPQLLALKRVIAEPERYGVKLPDIDGDERLVSVRVAEPIDVDTAARLAGLSVASFRAYNPGLLRPVIPLADDGSASFVLPEAAAETFRQALPSHRGPLSAWVLLRQARTETLRAIAKRHGLAADTLRRANGLPPATVTLVAGSAFLMPREAARKADAKEVTSDAPTPTGADRTPVKVSYSALVPARVHIAHKGETLKAIARQHRVGTTELRQWNRLPRGATRVAAGSRLIVSPAIPPRPRYVAVDAGELHPAARIVRPVGRSL